MLNIHNKIPSLPASLSPMQLPQQLSAASSSFQQLSAASNSFQQLLAAFISF
jgi:hypothetical protein